ncbi:MAG: twin-arginine translocase subunit TatC [Candidatus Omnitrophota bacterium]
MEQKPDRTFTLNEHLEELRGRIIKIVIALLVGTFALFNYIGKILPFLVKPVGKLVFIAPQEAFVTNIKLAFFGGLFLSSPVILYQIWRFVSLGLEENERRYILIFGPLSFVFFVVGAAFGYGIIVPIGIRFLLGFATDFLTPMITVSRYVEFVGMLTLSFGGVFQLPLILLFLTKLGVVTPQFLRAKRRHAVVLIFIAAAFLTPPDVVTQCLMALPLLGLYELGVVFSRLAYKKTVM